MKDELIDAVFDAMPGGVTEFLKDWGYRQFAYAILDAAGHNSETQQLSLLMRRIKDLPPMTSEQVFEQRVSWAYSMVNDSAVTKEQVRAVLLRKDGREPPNVPHERLP